MDLAVNNLQRLICHKTQQTKPIIFHPTITHHRNNSRRRLSFTSSIWVRTGVANMHVDACEGEQKKDFLMGMKGLVF